MTVVRRRGRPKYDDVLTPAEWRIVHAVKHGMTNREIAERRGISLDAVKFHVANIIAKLGVSNRKALRQWFATPKGSALARRERSPAAARDAQREPQRETQRETFRRRGVSRESHVEGDDMNAPLDVGQIGQIARTVKDIERAREWYGKVLGLPHLYTFGDLAFFDCGGTRLMLTQQREGSSTESILYWRVADIVRAHEQLKQRGVEFVNAPHMIHKHGDGTEEWMAFFKDPEGRSLAIMSQVKSHDG
jgi:DNA-binding CsgD family transcriptional regulator/extradiol dioxygenase family protein